MEAKVRLAGHGDLAALAALMIEFYEEGGFPLSAEAAEGAFVMTPFLVYDGDSDLKPKAFRDAFGRTRAGWSGRPVWGRQTSLDTSCDYCCDPRVDSSGVLVAT